MFKSWLVAHENWVSVGSFLVPRNCKNGGFCTIYPRPPAVRPPLRGGGRVTSWPPTRLKTDLSTLHFGVATPLNRHTSYLGTVKSHFYIIILCVNFIKKAYAVFPKGWHMTSRSVNEAHNHSTMSTSVENNVNLKTNNNNCTLYCKTVTTKSTSIECNFCYFIGL